MENAQTNPIVVTRTLLAVEVCVPLDWNEDQIVAFANHSDPCKREDCRVRYRGPKARRHASKVPCACRQGYTHVTLDK